MKLKKMVAASFAGVLALVVTAGPAFADCVNASRPDTVNVVIAAHSRGFVSLDEALLFIFQVEPGSREIQVGRLALGLCEARAQYLVDKIDIAAAQTGSSIDPTWVVGINAVQSGGLESASNPHARANLSNGRGIDLFRDNEELWNLILANIGDANLISCQP